MVDAGHIKQQARVSHCPDFKFNCESENQISKKMDAKKKIFRVDKLSVDKINHYLFAFLEQNFTVSELFYLPIRVKKNNLVVRALLFTHI